MGGILDEWFPREENSPAVQLRGLQLVGRAKWVTFWPDGTVTIGVRKGVTKKVVGSDAVAVRATVSSNLVFRQVKGITVCHKPTTDYKWERRPVAIRPHLQKA